MNAINRSVMITGSSGFLGRHVVRRFRAAGWNTVSTVRVPRGVPGEVKLDFSNSAVLSDVSKLQTCDAVVHLATFVDFSKKAKPEEFFSTNEFAASVLSRLCLEWDARLLFVSGTLVYGEQEYINVNTKPRPNLPYGKSKFLAEKIFQSSGIKNTILRSSGIFGYQGPEHLGINTAISRVINNNEVPVCVGDGTAKRNYIYVKDLANIIYYCVSNQVSGVHIAAGREIISIGEMLDIICDVCSPGSQKQIRPGYEGRHAIAEHSKHLPIGRGFKESIEDLLLCLDGRGIRC